MRRKRVAGILSLLLALLGSSAFLPGCDGGCAPKGEGRKITVAITPGPASAPVFIAHDKGFFREEGLDVSLEPYPSGLLGIAALYSGKADIAAASETPIARAALDGRPIAVLATVSSSNRTYQVLARKDRGIASARDLVGRTVGRVAETGAAYYLDLFLVASSVDPANVRIVSLDAERVKQALLDGEVDAVCTWPPHTIVLRERLGSRGAVLSEPGLYTSTWSLVAAKGLPEREPGTVERFLRAIVRANRFIVENPPEARLIAAKRSGIDPSLMEKEWGDYHFAVGLDQSLVLLLEEQARWMIRQGIAPGRRVPEFLKVLAPEGLRTVQPESVEITGR